MTLINKLLGDILERDLKGETEEGDEKDVTR